MKTHYFIAVPVPTHVAAHLARWVAEHQEEYPFQSWTHSDDYHLTLFFLGAASEEQLSTLREGLLIAAEQTQPFVLTLTHFHTFGVEHRPRIFSASPAGQPALHDLQARVHAVCLMSGFDAEDRPYRPHVTLAKKWLGKNEFVLPELSRAIGVGRVMETLEKRAVMVECAAESATPDEHNLTWVADKMVLYEISLGQKPKYQPVMEFGLGCKGEVTL